ncbi:cell adhesion molecule 3-like [Ptychodera flava]|uniref:cell adhesion molecule 3-like n=1 Tax=Ptychodera flava TaxID=63121 RepID=UPI003969D08E
MARCVFGQLSVFLGTLMTASLVTTTPAFVKEPNDTVVMEGDTAVLMCSVANLRAGFEVQWESDRNFTLSTNRTVLGKHLKDRVEPSRYSIVGDSTVGEFNLQIEGVDVTDDDQYMCAIFDTILGHPVSTTSKAQLKVDSPPTGYYPKCRPSTLKNYYLEGDTLKAKCIFRKTNKTLDLQWYKSGILLSGNRAYSYLADVTYQWPLTAADNGAKITCVANETLTCDVGPVEIYFKPRPAMVSAIVEVIVGEPAVFKVKGDWNPSPSLYSWSVNNMEVANNSLPLRFSNDGSTLTIFDTQPQDDNASVSCDVSNSVGNARAFAKLRVRPSKVQTIYTSPKTTDIGVTSIRTVDWVTPAVSPRYERGLSPLVIVLIVEASTFSLVIAAVILYFAILLKPKMWCRTNDVGQSQEH